ncbi:MAG: hypothetical protein RI947_1546 [Candidatus Parcubacteria bacterium]
MVKKTDIIPLLKEATASYSKTLNERVFTPLSEHKMKKLQQTIKSFIPEE